MSLNIRPFRALRAKNHLVKKVVMPAFDNLNAEDISKIIKNSKWNFLNVISPEAFYPGISKKLSKSLKFLFFQTNLHPNLSIKL